MATIRQWTGVESRCLRQAMRLSVRAFAEALGIETRTVGKWEQKGATARLRPDSHALLDTALARASAGAQARFSALLATDGGDGAAAVPGTSLEPHQAWRAASARRTVDGGGSRQEVPAVSLEWGDYVLLEEDDVERRAFLASAGLGLAGADSMAGLESLRHGLLSVVGGDDADGGDWEAIAREYGTSYGLVPPHKLVADLARDLAVAREHLGQVKQGTARYSMQGVAAQLAACMALTMGDLGKYGDSRRWWRFARRCADESTSIEIGTWVRGREIVRGLHEHRDLDDLLELADEALATCRTSATGADPRVLAGKAQTLARLGRGDDARRTMRELYDVCDRLPSRVASDLGPLYGWPESHIARTESFVYTHIGDSRRAQAAQEHVLSLYDENPLRSRTQVQMQQAMRLIHDGDPSAGAASAVEALVDLPHTQRTGPVMEVARWTAEALPADMRRRPEATELRELVSL